MTTEEKPQPKKMSVVIAIKNEDDMTVIAFFFLDCNEIFDDYYDGLQTMTKKKGIIKWHKMF